MNITIDSREQAGDRIKYAKKQYKQHEITVKYLETADFIFNQKVAFEYKTLPDFIKSVNDRRVFEQAERLNQEFKYPYVMIQGNEQELEAEIKKNFFLRKTKKGKGKPGKFSKKHFYGAIDRLNSYITVIQRPDKHSAFHSMLNTAKKCLDDAPVNKKVVKTGNMAYNCLRYCVGGVGDKTAMKLVKQLNLRNMEDVLNLSVDEMAGIKGVSVNKANVIYHNIHKRS